MHKYCVWMALAALVACAPGKADPTGGIDGATDSTSLPETSTIGQSSAPPTSDPVPTSDSPPTGAPPEPPVTTEPLTTSEPQDSTTTSGTTGIDPGAPTTDDGPIPLFPEETAATFISIPPDPPPGECNPWKEDCPAGLKCMPSNTGEAASWDVMKCVPVVPDPVPVGSPCVVEGHPTSGIDNCDKHAMCWDVDAELQGTCVPLCGGEPDFGTCEPGFTCLEANGGVVTACVPSCDPLLGTCPMGQVCVPAWGDFACVPDASGDGGQLFEACAAGNTCDPGLVCADAALSPKCADAQGECCLPICDADEQAGCPPEHGCMPWFEPGFVDPPLDDIGVCAAG